MQRTLETIREGSILYIGLNYNINETGNLTKKLTLFLGTEVLFSLAGFNGEVYKQLAEDLFAQIKSANFFGTNLVMDLVQKIILAMSTSYLRQERYCQPLSRIT